MGKNYARKIKAIRKGCDLTRKELAERIGGVHQNTIYKWETGQSLPQIDFYDKIMEIGRKNGIEIIEKERDD